MSDLLPELQKVLEADLSALDPGSMPLLAHYTTMDVLEKIMRNDEIWFSHPTLMNDHAEVLDGIELGTQSFLHSNLLMDTLGPVAGLFVKGLMDARNEYGTMHLFDTYIFSLSAHHPDDYDGRLSMWRGYGADGNGAAIVIDPKKMRTTAASPLVFERVVYKTAAQRMAWLDDLWMRIAQFVANRTALNDEWILAGHNTFDRIALASIFSKHIGFDEEREWRVVYMPKRDPNKLLKDHLSYFNGPRGLEPKLKFKLQPLPNVADGLPRLVDLTDRIILGPSRATPVLVATAKRMLVDAKKPQLEGRVYASTIPFRSTI
jgi:hypothetical protein